MSVTGKIEAHVAIGAPPRGDISIIASGGHGWLTFHPDGRVTADPDMAPDDAARAIIGLLVQSGWLKYAAPWQDISTAPKDGTVMLLWGPAHKNWVGNGWWDREKSRWLMLDTCSFTLGFRHVTPTHWQPLPAPPETEA